MIPHHNDTTIAAMSVPSKNNIHITKRTFIYFLFFFLMDSKIPVE